MSEQFEPVTGSRPAAPGASPLLDAGAARARWFTVAGIGLAPSGRGPHQLGASSSALRRRSTHVAYELPCRLHDPELWFAEAPADLEQAKALCAQCPIRLACLAVAVDRAEFAGVWGGHIFDRGRIVPRKRPRGRPRGRRRHQASTPDPPVPTTQDRTMTTDTHSTAATGRHDSEDRVHTAAAHLYDAECALHVAHQSHVDGWISAATEKLHHAVTEYLAAADACPTP